jgi:hypothetical protein
MYRGLISPCTPPDVYLCFTNMLPGADRLYCYEKKSLVINCTAVFVV